MSKNNLIYSPFKKWKKIFFSVAFDFFDTLEWFVVVFNLILGSQGNMQYEMPPLKNIFKISRGI